MALPAPPTTAVAACPECWGARGILEPTPLGYLPVVCERCGGTGRAEPAAEAPDA